MTALRTVKVLLLLFSTLFLIALFLNIKQKPLNLFLTVINNDAIQNDALEETKTSKQSWRSQNITENRRTLISSKTITEITKYEGDTRLTERVDNAEAKVSTLFGGDVSFDTPIRGEHGSNCDYKDIFKHVKTYFKQVDYSLFNLESPLVNEEIIKHPKLPGKGIHLAAWSDSVEAILDSGVKAVTLANNHINDFGDASIELTMETLKKNSIPFVGVTRTTGTDSYSPQVPLVININGVKIGVLGYCGCEVLGCSQECWRYRNQTNFGPAMADRITMKHDINRLKLKVDIIVVVLHWGQEYLSIPYESQRELAVYLSTLEVKLVVGSHSHNLQGHEWINDTLVHYSMGNFVYHGRFTDVGEVKYLTAYQMKWLKKSATKQIVKGRGSPTMTELLKVTFNKTSIIKAYYLPIRIHADRLTGCIYPKPNHGRWLPVCGEEDNNCYQPRTGDEYFP